MVVEIEKLEAAARMAMGHFEGHGPTATKPRFRLPHPVYALLAVTVAIGLAATLL